MVLDRLETRQKIAQLIAEVERTRDALLDEEVDGWVIRRPAMFEVDDHFGILFAESRDGCSAPLILPQSREICVGVIAGEIQLGGLYGTLKAQQFFVVRPKDSRSVYAVTHGTKIAAFFFRGPHDDTELDGREAS